MSPIAVTKSPSAIKLATVTFGGSMVDALMKRFLYRCILLLSDADERLKSATAEKLERSTSGQSINS
jgi:hypothetical protein